MNWNRTDLNCSLSVSIRPLTFWKYYYGDKSRKHRVKFWMSSGTRILVKVRSDALAKHLTFHIGRVKRLHAPLQWEKIHRSKNAEGSCIAVGNLLRLVFLFIFPLHFVTLIDHVCNK